MLALTSRRECCECTRSCQWTWQHWRAATAAEGLHFWMAGASVLFALRKPMMPSMPCHAVRGNTGSVVPLGHCTLNPYPTGQNLTRHSRQSHECLSKLNTLQSRDRVLSARRPCLSPGKLFSLSYQVQVFCYYYYCTNIFSTDSNNQSYR